MIETILVPIYEQIEKPEDKYLIQSTLIVRFKIDNKSTQILTDLKPYLKLNPSLIQNIDYELEKFINKMYNT